MVEQTNIKIESEDTKKIRYKLNLDEDYWVKFEYDSGGNLIHYRDTLGLWYEYGKGNSNKFCG